MLPRSKSLRVLLFVVPLVLVALLWNAACHRPSFVATPSIVMALAISQDGRASAAALNNGEFIWRRNKEWNTLPIAATETLFYAKPELQFAPDAQTLLGANIYAPNRSLAYAWNLKNNKVDWSRTMQDSRGIDNRFCFSADGQTMALLSYDVVKVLDVGAPRSSGEGKDAFPTLMRAQLPRPYKKTGEMRGFFGNAFPSQIALSADGKMLVVADHVERLQFFDVATGKRRALSKRAPVSQSQIVMMAVSPNGRFVAVCNSSIKGIAIWDANTRLWTQTATSRGAHEVAWMPDSQSLWLGTHEALTMNNNNALVLDTDDKIRQLSVPALQTLHTLPASGPVAVSGDGKTLATRAYTKRDGIWLWNIN